MTHRIPVAFATALALSGCALGGPGATLKPSDAGAPVPMAAKVTKVQAMTRTFSVAKNPGLSKAAHSFKTLATALQGAFAGISLTPGASVEDAAAAVRTAGMRAAYQASGVAEQGGARLIVDDATGEVTAIEAPDARIRFSFVNAGAKRVWEAVIEKSPDGTTGKFHLEITGEWQPLPEQVTARAPYRLVGNEYPTRIEAVTFALELQPKGDAATPVTLAGTFDEPQALPGSSLSVPTRWALDARFAKVSLDWKSRLELAPGRSRLAGDGALRVETELGTDAFTYTVRADEQARNASFALTNVAAKVTLLVTGSQKAPTAPPQLKSLLVSTEDGSHLGTVALDPQRPRFAVVTFNDGSTTEWELYPEGMWAAPEAFARPAAPPAFAD